MDGFFKAVGMVAVGGFALLALMIARVFGQAVWALLIDDVRLEVGGVTWRRNRWPWRWQRIAAPEPQHQDDPS